MSEPVSGATTLPHRLHQALQEVRDLIADQRPLDLNTQQRLMQLHAEVLALPNRSSENGRSHDNMTVLVCYHAMAAYLMDAPRLKLQFTAPNPFNLLQLIRDLLKEQYYPPTKTLLHACQAMLEHSLGNTPNADNAAEQACTTAQNTDNLTLGSAWLLRSEVGAPKYTGTMLREAVRCFRGSNSPEATLSELRARMRLARRNRIARWLQRVPIARLNRRLRELGMSDDDKNRLLKLKVVPGFLPYSI